MHDHFKDFDRVVFVSCIGIYYRKERCVPDPHCSASCLKAKLAIRSKFGTVAIAGINFGEIYADFD